MRYLIDTHTLIWYLDGDKQLPRNIKDELSDEKNLVIISVVSLRELTIKAAKKKDKVDFRITLPEIETYIFERDFMLLNIELKHLHKLSVLPGHHGDPFDRMMIAQAITENLTLISEDKAFSAYPVNVTW